MLHGAKHGVHKTSHELALLRSLLKSSTLFQCACRFWVHMHAFLLGLGPLCMHSLVKVLCPVKLVGLGLGLGLGLGVSSPFSRMPIPCLS